MKVLARSALCLIVALACAGCLPFIGSEEWIAGVVVTRDSNIALVIVREVFGYGYVPLGAVCISNSHSHESSTYKIWRVELQPAEAIPITRDLSLEEVCKAEVHFEPLGDVFLALNDSDLRDCGPKLVTSDGRSIRPIERKGAWVVDRVKLFGWIDANLDEERGGIGRSEGAERWVIYHRRGVPRMVR